MFFIIEVLYLRSVTFLLQRSVPYPPRHLMSSAPSNSPGILTVLKTKSKLAGQCKYKDILTSDDFPVNLCTILDECDYLRAAGLILNARLITLREQCLRLLFWIFFICASEDFP